MQFRRRKGYRIKTNPQVVGEYCYGLEQAKGGKLTPKDLVKAARDVNSPLHNEFEWEDSVAAEKYREWQARYIISSIEVVLNYLPSETKKISPKLREVKIAGVKFYHTLDVKGGYENVFTIGENEEKQKKLLENFLKDVDSLKEQYDSLRAVLPKLFNAMDGARDEVAV